MQYSIFATAALFSASVFAQYPVEGTSTVSVTDVLTITSCGPEVTNCPASSYPTVSPSAPIYANHSVPVYPTTTAEAVPTTYPGGVETTPSAPYPTTEAEGGETSSVSLSTQYITTCIPTVITSIITVTPSPPAPTSSPAGPVGSGTGAPPAPSTYPSAPPPPFTNGASSIQGPLALVAAAGLLAFFA